MGAPTGEKRERRNYSFKETKAEFIPLKNLTRKLFRDIFRKKKKGKRMSKKKKIVIGIVSVILVLVLLVAGLVIDFLMPSNKLYYKNDKEILIPVFVYHDIVEEIEGPEYMQTEKDNFIEQIEGLQKIGYEFISYEDLKKYDQNQKALPEKVAILSFDDGYEGNYKILYPIVKEKNIKVEIAVINDQIGKTGYLNWEQIKEMEDSGLVTIGSHGKSHIDYTQIAPEQFKQDILFTFKQIEEQVGKQEVNVFVYPYGLVNDQLIESLQDQDIIQNLTDNKVNNSKKLDLDRLHREYPLNDSVFKIILKTFYRSVRYGDK